MIRTTCLTICCFALCLGAGCQSGAVGFRNPFRNPFVKAVPEPGSDLVAKSVGAEEKPDVFQVAQQEVQQQSPEPPATASVKPIPDSLGQSDRERKQPESEVERLLARGDKAYASQLLTNAAAFYDEVVRLDPQNVHAHHRLAIIADQQKNYQLAETHYIAALNVQPENTNLLNDLGYSYYLQKKFQDSEAYLSYVLEKNPGKTLAMKNLGLVYAAQGNSQQAYALLQQGGLNPGDIQQQMQRAIAHAGQAPSNQASRGMASTATPRGSASTGIQPTGGQANMNSRGNMAAPADFSQEYPPNSYPPRTPSAPESYQNPAQNFQAPNPTSAQKPAYPQQSNYPPNQTEAAPSGPSNHELERAALNTGFGNLFPITSPQDYHRAHQTRPVSWDQEGPTPEAVQNAYHQQFGDPRFNNSQLQNAHHSGREVPAIPASASNGQNYFYPSSHQTTPMTSGSANIQSPPNYEQFPQQSTQPQFQQTPQNTFRNNQPTFGNQYAPEQMMDAPPQNALREYQQGLRNEQSSPFSPSTYR